MIKLRLPVRHVKVNQPFGVNFVDFYQKLGLNGHNGTDFEAGNGFDCYASHDGRVAFAGDDGTGGICIRIIEEKEHFETIYYHLKDVCVLSGSGVKAGQLIGHCDNTGQYTTGSHLHFGLKQKDAQNFNTINYDNGYKGAIDPAPYFLYAFDGTPINPKDYDRSRAYHRYYRGRPNGGLINEVKVAKELTKYLRKLPNNEQINACTYGGWDKESIKNDSMYYIWSQLKKDEFLNGEKPFMN